MAKNISTFIPGFSPSSEMVDKCEFLFTVSKNPGDVRTHNYGHGCGRMCWQSNHCYKGDVDVKIFGSGGSAGGVCCCMLGTPGASGAYASFKVTPVYGEDNTFCWSQSAGGCCRPAFAGESSCNIWFKDPARSAGCVVIGAGFCACGHCNAPQANLCHEVCYQTPFCRDYTGSPTGGQGRFDCRECFTQAGTINASEFWVDSGVTMFPKVLGFIATSECNNGSGGGQVCKVVQFKNVPTVADGKKEHYMSMSFGGENCVGGSLNSCWQSHWFGACGSGDAAQYGSVCTYGTGGTGASANGGNCYCGGPEMGGGMVSFMYQLNTEIEG